MDKGYCLECLNKHLSRAEHHSEDLWTSSKDNPQLRVEAQEMLDQIREFRKRIDAMRIDELAKKKADALTT
jgi:hypothetical protein